MDYYAVLEISRDADDREIKRAYRQLARKYHPDVNNGSEEANERFKQLSEAFAVLSDPQKRRQYDTGGTTDFGFDAGMGSIFDIFNQAFGFGFAGGRHASPGRDIEYAVDIELEEVLTGTERTVTFERVGRCEACSGSGAAPGSATATCTTCAGRGQVRQRQDTILGSMVSVVTCPECGGSGQIVDEPCEECDGKGVRRHAEDIKVTVPPGIRDGQHLEYTGLGDMSPDGGPAGNLYVRVDVRDHDAFTRHDNHLAMSLDIVFAQAALGDTITVPTIDGETDIHIQPGTQSGEEIRLRGKGLPSLRSTRRGDQVVVVKVMTPTELSDRQIELLHELASEDGIELQTPPSCGLFDRVKQLFGAK